MVPNINSERIENNVCSSSSNNSSYETSWEPEMARKIKQRLEKLHDTNPNTNKPFMVALVGIPGGGKSVSSLLLAHCLEQQEDSRDDGIMGTEVTIMPHDGYHYTMEYLKKLPNAEDAIYRRGAPDTFDPAALQRDLERIRYGNEEYITVPGFDHGSGDPEPDQHAFDRRRHKVVICEGLYLLHDADGWEDVASMFDMKIFIESDVDACVERLKVRNLCIPGYTPEEIEIRCETVDRKNAMTVMRSKYRADEVVQSLVSTNVIETTLPRTRKAASFASLDLSMTTHQQSPEVAIIDCPVRRKTVSFASLDLIYARSQLADCDIFF